MFLQLHNHEVVIKKQETEDETVRRRLFSYSEDKSSQSFVNLAI